MVTLEEARVPVSVVSSQKACIQFNRTNTTSNL